MILTAVNAQAGWDTSLTWTETNAVYGYGANESVELLSTCDNSDSV